MKNTIARGLVEKVLAPSRPYIVSLLFSMDTSRSFLRFDSSLEKSCLFL